MKRITSDKEFRAAQTTVETLLNKATKQGGFHKLSDRESVMLAELSKQIEQHEDKTLNLMPVKPKSIGEAIEYKKIEMKLTQGKLAALMGIEAPKLSQILSGKRPPDLSFIIALYRKLRFDPEFILEHVGKMNGHVKKDR